MSGDRQIITSLVDVVGVTIESETVSRMTAPKTDPACSPFDLNTIISRVMDDRNWDLNMDIMLDKGQRLWTQIAHVTDNPTDASKEALWRLVQASATSDDHIPMTKQEFFAACDSTNDIKYTPPINTSEPT